MKKEEKSKVIQPSEMILQDKIKQREKIRQGFIEEKKERYKNKEINQDNNSRKKKIIAQIKEVFADG